MFQWKVLVISLVLAWVLQRTFMKRPLEAPPPASSTNSKYEEKETKKRSKGQRILKKKQKPDTIALMDTMRISLTFGDAGWHHYGMETFGDHGEIGSGFSPENLLTIKKNLEGLYQCEYLDFSRDDCETKAGVLVIRNLLNQEETENVFEELNGVDWDRQFYDVKKQKVVKKSARASIVIQDGISQTADYENTKGTIIDGNTIPHYKQMQDKFVTNLKKSISTSANDQAASKFDNLICEGNKYFNLKKCGIAYHGDAERRKVICVSLGANNYPIQWVWFQNNKPVSEPFRVNLNNGDMYIMSEKAVGYDKQSPLTLRHAAGADNYISLKRFNK